MQITVEMLKTACSMFYVLRSMFCAEGNRSEAAAYCGKHHSSTALDPSTALKGGPPPLQAGEEAPPLHRP